MNYAGLIYDDSLHYLDHLAPFCALLKWPLIVCEARIAELARLYYPDLEVIEKDLWRLQLPAHIVTCDNRPLLQAAFPGQIFQTLWLPHGHSDKGTRSPFFEALREETIALVYGQKIIDFMREKKVTPNLVRVGNFRWQYYLKHRPFYEKILPRPRSGKNILYAPTWDDFENNSSFWSAFPHLAKTVPDLLIKLHPNTVKKFEPELEILKGRHPNVHFLPDIPPIYPLLSHCDAYIGDMSSIGYDFLRFEKPLFFLNGDKHFLLHRCGTPIDPKTFALPTDDPHASLRKELYDYTFDPSPSSDRIKEQIYALRSL